MSIDQQLRQATTATYKAVGRPDVDAALRTFHAARRRRQRTRFVGIALLAGALLAGGLALEGPGSQPGTATDPPPATRGGDAPLIREPAPTDADGRCGADQAVRCLAPRTVVVDGAVRYSVTAPPPIWSEMDLRNAPEVTEVYQRRRQAGVAFFLDPRAADTDRPFRSTAEAAAWVASRPFLQPTTAEPTRVDTLVAWRVDAVLKDSVQWPLERSCHGTQTDCRALLSHYEDGTHETGPWRTMLSRYTFVDGPGPHTLVIWSWAFGQDAKAMAVNAELVRTVDILGGG